MRGFVHSLSVDTPRRDPKDIIFVNPADGTPETFILRNYYAGKKETQPRITRITRMGKKKPR